MPGEADADFKPLTVYPVPEAYKGFHEQDEEDEEDGNDNVIAEKKQAEPPSFDSVMMGERPQYPVPEAYRGFSTEKDDDLAGLKL